MSVDKAFAALGVGAAGSVGTYFLVVRSGAADAMPDKYVLLADHSAETYSSKIGDDFKDFLVAATEGGEGNKSWWEWAFKKWSSDKDAIKGAEFAKDLVTSAFSTGDSADSKALNRVCKAVYDKVKSEIEGEGDKSKRKQGLWRYCSPLGEIPLTVEQNGNEHEDYKSKLGASKKDKLISITSSKNELYWKLKTKAFYASDAPGTSDAFFNALHTSDKTKAEDKRQNLKTKCEAAYKTTAASSSDANAPTETEALKYCSLNGS